MVMGKLEHKPHLVRGMLCVFIERKGALGIKRHSSFSNALLSKWNKGFACKRSALWSQVITWKYGEGWWCSCEAREVNLVGMQKGIRMLGSWKDLGFLS